MGRSRYGYKSLNWGYKSLNWGYQTTSIVASIKVVMIPVTKSHDPVSNPKTPVQTF